jgi:hypothetical protein
MSGSKFALADRLLSHKLMGPQKSGISMLWLLGIKSYETVAIMGHKIRRALADRDIHYELAGLIEMDATYFGTQARETQPRRRRPGQRVSGGGTYGKKPPSCCHVYGTHSQRQGDATLKPLTELIASCAPLCFPSKRSSCSSKEPYPPGLQTEYSMNP